MRRRPLCALVALSFAAAMSPLGAQPSRVARLGFLNDVGRADPSYAVLLSHLAERGWVEGRNLAVEFLVVDEDPNQSEALARRLAQLNCDVILAKGVAAALAVHAGAPKTPKVFVMVADPVALGIVATLQRPGGNATGFAGQSQEIAVKQLSLLREMAPAAKRVALMFHDGNISMSQSASTVELVAKPLGLAVRRFPLRGGQDVDAAHQILLREPADGMLVLLDRVTYVHRWEIIAMANQLRLPTVYGSRFFTEYGGLVSFGIDWPALVVASADYVARILDGAKPADLPVQQPTRFELVVNRRGARTLGVTLPRSVLLQATEVIE